MLPNMPDVKPEFTRVQYQFTAHIRQPDRNPAPDGLPERRMRVYRELLYNNIESFIANNYPVLRKILPDARWHAMVRDFFATHQSHTPLFPKMPQEFLRYLEEERDNQSDPPFLLELAHYEWVESALLFDSREIDMAGIDADGDFALGIPVLSPLAWPFAYRFPVHRISPDYLPEAPPSQPSYLVVYRNKSDDVGFMELNAVTARLIEKLQAARDLSGTGLLEEIAEELRHPDARIVVNGGLDVLRRLHAKDVVLGVRR